MQLLWVNVRLYLTLEIDVIYVKSTLIELKKWLILKFEFPAPDCDWSIQICDLRYLRVYKNNQNFLMSILYCIDLIILSQTPFNKDINLIKVNNINKQLYHILCVFYYRNQFLCLKYNMQFKSTYVDKQSFLLFQKRTTINFWKRM